jgi:hypothetical protein
MVFFGYPYCYNTPQQLSSANIEPAEGWLDMKYRIPNSTRRWQANAVDIRNTRAKNGRYASA